MSNHPTGRAVRDRMARTGQKFTAAREEVLKIRELARDRGLSYEDAEVLFDLPRLDRNPEPGVPGVSYPEIWQAALLAAFRAPGAAPVPADAVWAALRPLWPRTRPATAGQVMSGAVYVASVHKATVPPPGAGGGTFQAGPAAELLRLAAGNDFDVHWPDWPGRAYVESLVSDPARETETRDTTVLLLAAAHAAELGPGGLARRVKARMDRAGCGDGQALAEAENIIELADENDWTYEEAEEFADRPENQVICDVCGWTAGMVCPECAAGCGCETRCTGWRHEEQNAFADDFGEEGKYCRECGADSHYQCSCVCSVCGREIEDCEGHTEQEYAAVYG